VNEEKHNPTNKQSPSLFDDALSDRMNKSKKSKYLWPIFIVVIGLGMTYSIFYGASEKKEELIAQLEESAAEEATSLEKQLAEMRSRQKSANEKNLTKSDAGVPEETPSVAKSAPAGDKPPETRPRPSPKATQQEKITTPPVKTETRPLKAEPLRPTEASVSTPPSDNLPDTSSNQQASVSIMDPVSSDDSETEMEPAPEPEPLIPVEHELAYNLLLENSVTAGKLANGEYSTLNYVNNWRVVQENKSELWIDLIAHWANGGDSVHFIWAVNQETRKVRALSQAARNLDSDNKGEAP
jgi:hypothetical protein